MDFDVTGLTVYYRTDIKYIESFKKIYSDVPLIIVDNSADERYAEILKRINADIIVNEKNLGHSGGLSGGIKKVKTKYVLIFDSDVEFINYDLIPDMLKLIGNNYGVGFTVWLKNGLTLSKKENGAIRYLHPFCALISIEMYNKFVPFPIYNKANKYHGAPMLDPIVSLNNDNLLVHLPDSQYTKCKYWNHVSGATRIFIKHE